MPSEQRALVTGTSSGIGKAIAERLLSDGWHVTGLDIAAPSLKSSMFTHVTVDLSDGSAAEASARQAGSVQAWVHAAGVLRVGRVGSLKPLDAELMWRLHVQAALCIANVVLPAMTAAKHGRAVLVGSRVSAGLPGRSQYAASKASLVALARSWAAEVVAQGVTVNVVSPAATQTAMLDDPARSTENIKVPPLGRLIQPAEIASLVAYLLSPDAAAITGQDISICGGATLPR